MCQRPDMDDLPHTEWQCPACKAVNSMWDGECQFCDHRDEPDDEPDDAPSMGHDGGKAQWESPFMAMRRTHGVG